MSANQRNDDFDQSSEPLEEPPLGRRKSSARLVLGIVAATGGVALLVCCGCGFWFYRSFSTEVPAARAEADAFLNDLQAGDVEAAHARTAKPFQQAATVEQFRAMLEVAPSVTNQTSRHLQLVRIFSGSGGSHAIFRATFQSPNGPGAATLTLRKENGRWKVLGLNLDAATFKKPAAADEGHRKGDGRNGGS